ncbi:PLAT domain-containing protein 3-like [Trifolium pratense]|uniref:PLAT domain-containing protein 3-like n=1 Tax=Trifolium pratense TaxID=57577 RepID=UPI001E691F8C|nr:PLAT domain-containing protein 3-like [Trifolium pratense]
MANPTHLLPLLFLLSFCFTATVKSDEDCVYTVYVRTGSIIKAGTDSIMTLTLYNANGYGILIKNLEAWGGLMGSGYNYFERGNLDIFSGRGPCLDGPICNLNLTSDGSGSHHGWYCNYVEVTSTGVHTPCAQHEFTVEQWLATDTSPYELTAIRNDCQYNLGQARPELKIVDAVRSEFGTGPDSNFSILRSAVH